MALKILKSRIVPLATVSSVTSFIEAVGKAAAPGGSVNAFRGQRNATWSTAPGILRPPQKLLDHEREIIRELVSVHPQEFRDDHSMLDRLVRMQHFGLPTRLLDVTLNPLVALYFATEPYGSKTLPDGIVMLYTIGKPSRKYYDSDAVACIANLANLSTDERQEIIDSDPKGNIASFNGLDSVDRLLQFVKEEKPHFRSILKRDDLFTPYYVVPKMSNRRIIAQSGAFIIHGLEENPDPSSGIRPVRRIKNQRIVIPQLSKLPIRRELEALGINESTLFPEIDRAASYIVRRFS